MTVSRLLSALVLLASLFSRAAAAAPVVPQAVPNLDAPHVADQLLVKLLAPGAASSLPGGAKLLREIPELGLALIQLPAGDSLAQAAADLTGARGVEWAEPNYTISLDLVPDDPGYLARQQPYLARIAAEAAWDLTEGRPETIIGVLDTGVQMDHEDLVGAIWTNPGESPDNGIDDDGNGFVDDVHGWDFAANDNDPSDDYGHGTHVAGIAAARIGNGIGIAGIAGRATIMPVDVFQGGIGTYEALIRAIVYATDNGARVINMSLGASSYSRGEEAAVDYAYEHGVVVVAAAGNSGREEGHYPAAHVHAIAVASTTVDDHLSSFSTRGDFVDVAAPGSSIYSTYLGNSYQYLSGTSMAAPHVSGLAALILSRNPDLTPDQVQAIIESTTDDLEPVGRDIYFGAGRINMGRALAATAEGGAPPPTPTPGPGLDIDLPGCTELLNNGGFEAGLVGWETSGAVEVVSNPASTGQASLHFKGGPGAHGVITQTFMVPSGANAALLRFDYRIDPKDYGRGTSPAWPFDDWFTAEWRSSTDVSLGELLRTGNTADTVTAGLEWDHYIYRLSAADLAPLAAGSPVKLVFTSQNDSDSFPTDIWVDGVSFCATRTSLPYKMYWPFYTN
jgi:subtilisin family serine protease